MDKSIELIIDKIIQNEGGFTVDQGGPTNWGITIPFYSEYLGRQAITQDIIDLTPESAKLVYFDAFKFKYGIHAITNYQLLYALFDACVNHGPDRPKKWLQKIAGVVADGELGPVSLKAINSNPKSCYYGFIAKRIEYFAHITVVSPERNLKSLNGWIKRGCSFIKEFSDD